MRAITGALVRDALRARDYERRLLANRRDNSDRYEADLEREALRLKRWSPEWWKNLSKQSTQRTARIEAERALNGLG